MRIAPLYLPLCLIAFIAACTPAPSAAPATVLARTPAAVATSEGLFTSDGGGEPRTPGYWLLWNTCAGGNKSETARANGGRAAGWLVMDDLLADPGVLVGAIAVDSCPLGVNLLQARDAQGRDRQSDAAYALAAQLLAAQINLAAGSEDCPAADQAVRAAQLLLISLEFDATRDYLPASQAGPDVETAALLTGQLANYNTGGLCVP